MFKALGSRSGVGARWPIIVLAFGFALLMGVAAATAWILQDARRQNGLVEHTMEVQAQASEVLIAALNAETGVRGYLLTGRRDFRGVFEIGAREAPVAFARLRAMTSDNPNQAEPIALADRYLQERVAFLTGVAEQVDRGQRDVATSGVRTGVGKAQMDRLRREIDLIQANEQKLLVQRRDAAERATDLVLALTIAALIVAAALAFAAIVSMLRYARGLESANDEVLQLNEGLEARVVERTADLQEANDEIQRFAYIVSHDLRSPLVNVMGFTSELEAAGEQARDLLGKAELAAPTMVTKDHRLAVIEDLPEAIGFIRTSTAKMDRLINAILRLSREGRRTLAPEPIDMTQLLKDIAAALHQQTEAADATVSVGALPPLEGDRLALDQIFGNLVENAVKYLDPARPGRISVTGKTLGSLAEYTIEDNGRGIDKADLERVFDLFRRAGAQDRPGEGIGLAHVRALVRRLGGTIALTSEIGQGSRFIVTLPVQLKGIAGE